MFNVRFKSLIVGVIISVTAINSILVFADTQFFQLTKVTYPISVDGGNVIFEKDILNHNGTTYVPLREVTNATGANIDWDSNNQMIKITKQIPKTIIKEVPKIVTKEVIKEIIKEVPKEVIKEVIKEDTSKNLELTDLIYSMDYCTSMINNQNRLEECKLSIANYITKVIIGEYAEISNKETLINIQFAEIRTAIEGTRKIKDELFLPKYLHISTPEVSYYHQKLSKQDSCLSVLENAWINAKSYRNRKSDSSRSSCMSYLENYREYVLDININSVHSSYKKLSSRLKNMVKPS